MPLKIDPRLREGFHREGMQVGKCLSVGSNESAKRSVMLFPVAVSVFTVAGRPSLGHAKDMASTGRHHAIGGRREVNNGSWC